MQVQTQNNNMYFLFLIFFSCAGNSFFKHEKSFLWWCRNKSPTTVWQIRNISEEKMCKNRRLWFYITKYNWIAGHLGGMSHDVVDHKKKLLLSICRDICNGLQFLHEHLVYPFDLAARCCQLSSDLRVKIGDYGLSRYITTKINLKRHYKLKFYCFKSCIFQVCTLNT